MTIEDVLADPKLMAAINYTLNRFYYVDPDERESIKLVTIWECLKKYDPTKAKLQTFICLNLYYKLQKYLTKNKREQRKRGVGRATSNLNTFEILDGLDPELQNLLILKYVHEKTYEEIAAELNMPYSTVIRQIRRAKSILREET